jgi:RIO kinase 1
MSVKELFDYVTDLSITSANQDAYLDNAMAIASSRTLEELNQLLELEDEVCETAYMMFLYIMI